MTAPLLSIEDLRVGFSTRHGLVEALRGISLGLHVGETLGIVGESGSGKSVTALAVMRLLDRAGRISAGRISFRGQDITHAPRHVLQPLRGAAMSMIFQNPRAALNPIRTVGLQIADVLRAHEPLSAREARDRAGVLLEAVRIRDPLARLDAYPHELSGGMCQRVMIAMAIACEPALLIADEPTTGLDATTQKTVMDLLSETTARRGMAMVLITHDLGLAAQYCGRIAVMQQGLVVEEAPPHKLFGAPRHAYTRRLVAASPTRQSTIASLLPEASAAPPAAPAVPRGGRLLEVRGLVKRFAGTTAVDDVSFHLDAGESLGLVGESGSGKSTLSRLVCRLLDQTAGSIRFDGTDIGAVPARGFHRNPHRRDIQLVFQDHGGSLNPRFTAFQSIADPLKLLAGLGEGEALQRRVGECAERVGLPAELLGRFPHQLSGGQQARVGIARAIAARPRLLVLDEPTAALDVSVQAVILALLDRLRREEGLSFLFVSHDLNLVRMMCQRIIVLQAGKVVEEGKSDALFAAPRAAYTAELLAAIPHFAPEPSVPGTAG
ncbi:ABC transporter ATP-binding protein [Siccirubricoccus deserti]|uniref:ABC transporter ATP-binding protein n=1 Tax=Siccirubricoccus deserti TaxID=2013562 RepID=A0A9X0UC32_9PROT|nr:ABC transporter ATP-binding protein [Siccirubricoccus deserti]MBC4013991.1 ABC transporter ATP-binding protein [Siccirubricoccus deserti]GGC31158.1 ABC transporter ATP-binding protein [Siccirubricoccus deserti]